MAYRLSGTRNNPIDLLDRDDTGTVDRTDDPPARPDHRPSILRNDSDEEEDEAEALTAEPHKNDSDEALEITEKEFQDNQALAAQVAPAAVPRDHRRLKSTIINGGHKLVAGMSVEFYDGDFMRVKDILQYGLFGRVSIRGSLLRRNGKIGMFMEKQLNEVCVVLQVPAGSSEPMAGTCLISRPVAEVRRIREVVFTNMPFDRFSLRMQADYARYCHPLGRNVTERELARNEAMLTCRWKHVVYWDSTKKSVEQRDFKFLRQSEADAGKVMSDAVKRRAFFCKDGQEQEQAWDSKSVRTDCIEPNAGQKRKLEAIDLTGETDSEEVTTKFRKTFITDTFKKSKAGTTFFRRRESVSYETSTTFATSSSPPRSSQARNIGSKKRRRCGDICAGPGGMARGADDMRWSIELLLDKDPDVCKTLRLNYDRRAVCEMDLSDYLSEVRSGLRPADFDVLHVSLPCQRWSPAHTRWGKDDDANLAILFATDEILKQCRPRIVTFEQTSGLRTHYPYFFARFIQMIVRERYSLSEKLINCADLGNVHARKRLCIIASCPGQRTPSFPKATHGTRPGLKPLTTIADCLRKVRYPLEPHMQQHTDKRHKNLPRTDPNLPLKNAVTCDGGLSDTHPSGRRSHNIAELAMLQDFDPKHKFAPLGLGKLRKQVGNACPGCLARAIFAEVDKTLDETDAEEEREAATAIVID